MTDQLIPDIVENNWQRGYTLYNLGIHFYECPSLTLAQVCHQRRLCTASVVAELHQAAIISLPKMPVLACHSVRALLQHLHHSHRYFIRKKLPYIHKLIEDIDPALFTDTQLGYDLKLVLPIFAEDFIKHIHDEESRLFAYLNKLTEAAMNSHSNPAIILLEMEKNTLQKCMLEHTHDDDDMQGIRQLTNGYHTDEQSSLHMRVIYKELQQFEKDLKEHAGIENMYLFPQALKLENEVKQMLSAKTALN